MSALTAEQRTSWDEHGYFIVRGFADAATCTAMLDRAVDRCRRERPRRVVGRVVGRPGAQSRGPARREPEDFVSKVFILHTDDPVFAPFTVRRAARRAAR